MVQLWNSVTRVPAPRPHLRTDGRAERRGDKCTRQPDDRPARCLLGVTAGGCRVDIGVGELVETLDVSKLPSAMPPPNAARAISRTNPTAHITMPVEQSVVGVAAPVAPATMPPTRNATTAAPHDHHASDDVTSEQIDDAGRHEGELQEQIERQRHCEPRPD